MAVRAARKRSSYGAARKSQSGMGKRAGKSAAHKSKKSSYPDGKAFYAAKANVRKMRGSGIKKRDKKNLDKMRGATRSVLLSMEKAETDPTRKEVLKDAAGALSKNKKQRKQGIKGLLDFGIQKGYQWATK